MVVNAIFAAGTFSGNPAHLLFFLYTDPGSGALLWQLLLASFIGGAFYARQLLRQIKARITARRNDAIYHRPITEQPRSQAVK